MNLQWSTNICFILFANIAHGMLHKTKRHQNKTFKNILNEIITICSTCIPQCQGCQV